MKRQAFTLIELLVVVAIVAILGAILLPVFAQVRDSGRQTRCAANLRQQGAALLMYTHDWDGALPAAAELPSGEVLSWKDQLSPYAGKNPGLYLCPSNPIGWDDPAEFWGDSVTLAPGFVKGRKGDETGRYPVSYGANGFYFSQNADGYERPKIEDLDDASGTIAIGETRLTSILYPDFTGALLDGRKGAMDVGWFHHHDHRINFLFFDGHVKALRALDTFWPKPLWGSTDWIRKLPNGEAMAQSFMAMKPGNAMTKVILPEYR